MIFKKLISKLKRKDKEADLKRRVSYLEYKVDEINKEGANLLLINKAMFDNLTVKTFVIEEEASSYDRKTKLVRVVYFYHGRFYSNTLKVGYWAVANVIKDGENDAIIKANDDINHVKKIYMLGKEFNTLSDITKYYNEEEDIKGGADR